MGWEDSFVAKRKRRKLHRSRCIRSYRRLANQNHGLCDFCRDEIYPGEEYEGLVYVNGQRLCVVKQHTDCLPWDWDEEEMNQHGDEKEVETTVEEPMELPEAA